MKFNGVEYLCIDVRSLLRGGEGESPVCRSLKTPKVPLRPLSVRSLEAPWWRHGMTGGGGAPEVRPSRRTMLAPGVGISLLPGRLVLMLLLLSASEPTFSQACLGPLAATSGCSCKDERSKAHGVQAVGRRISCSKKELTEPPDVSLLPNRTVTL